MFYPVRFLSAELVGNDTLVCNVVGAVDTESLKGQIIDFAGDQYEVISIDKFVESRSDNVKLGLIVKKL